MRARKVAALYDIHGNLPALDAVLGQLETIEPDAIVVGGDFVLGPMPRETLERLRALGGRVRVVRGNADREVAAGGGGDGGAWAAKQLTREQRAFLAALPLTATVDVDGLGRVLFCHATPRSDEEIVTPKTAESRLGEILAGVEEDVVVCGHTHVQFDRRVTGKRVVNAGSVGLPYEGERGAYWTLLGRDVNPRRAGYDVEGAVERMRATGFPSVEEMFVEALLAPPTSDEVADYFEGVAAER